MYGETGVPHTDLVALLDSIPNKDSLQTETNLSHKQNMEEETKHFNELLGTLKLHEPNLNKPKIIQNTKGFGNPFSFEERENYNTSLAAIKEAINKFKATFEKLLLTNGFANNPNSNLLSSYKDHLLSKYGNNSRFNELRQIQSDISGLAR